MNRVRTGLYADIEHRSRPAAEFRRRVCLDIDLLDGIDGQDGGGIAEWKRRISDALPGEGIITIQSLIKIVVGLWLEPIRRHRVRSATRRGYHAWTELQQALEASAVQRQIQNR